MITMMTRFSIKDPKSIPPRTKQMVIAGADSCEKLGKLGEDEETVGFLGSGTDTSSDSRLLVNDDQTEG